MHTEPLLEVSLLRLLSYFFFQVFLVPVRCHDFSMLQCAADDKEQKDEEGDECAPN